MQDHTLLLELVKIFGSALVAIIAGVFAIFSSPKAQDFLSKNVFNKPLQNMGRALDASSKLEHLTTELGTIAGVVTGKFLQTANGGGIPQVGSVIYAQANYPSFFREAFGIQPVTPEFADKLSILYEKGKVEFWTKDLPVGSDLRVKFEAHNVQYCECFALKKYPEKFFFLAIDYNNKNLADLSQNRSRINDIVGNIKSIVNHDSDYNG